MRDARAWRARAKRERERKIAKKSRKILFFLFFLYSSIFYLFSSIIFSLFYVLSIPKEGRKLSVRPRARQARAASTRAAKAWKRGPSRFRRSDQGGPGVAGPRRLCLSSLRPSTPTVSTLLSILSVLFSSLLSVLSCSFSGFLDLNDGNYQTVPGPAKPGPPRPERKKRERCPSRFRRSGRGRPGLAGPGTVWQFPKIAKKLNFFSRFFARASLALALLSLSSLLSLLFSLSLLSLSLLFLLVFFSSFPRW